MSDANSFDYRSRIKHEVGRAERYSKRKQDKHDAEMEVIRKALEYVQNVDHFLDIPCGVGRATILLSRKGYSVTAADLGAGAIKVAREKIDAAGIEAKVESQDIEKMEFRDREFDAILCFRLYHHFPEDGVRNRVIDELCRVAGKYVLISYLNAHSWTSVRRMVRKRVTGQSSIQHSNTCADLESRFEKHGFRLVADIPRARFIHSLHLAVFERQA